MNDINLMNQTWNNYVSSEDIPKIKISLDEFLKKMNDNEYINNAINKLIFENRISSCQYVKNNKKSHGFSNFFLIQTRNIEKKLDEYLFIYKSNLDYSDDDNFQLLPAVSEYKIKSIDIDSLDYLANFSIYVNKKDYIYSVEKRKLMTYYEFLNVKEEIILTCI